MIRQKEIIPTTISGDLRRGGWVANQSVLNDTDLVGDGLNLQIRGKCFNQFVDPVFSPVLDLHAIRDPDFNFQRHGSNANPQAGTADEFLKKKEVQSISFAAVASPSNSHERTSWNFAHVIDHILRQHTNFIYDPTGANGSPEGWITSLDFDFTNSTSFEVFIVRKSSNIWSTLQRIGGGEEGGGEFYRIFCTKTNTIVYQPAPMFLSNPIRATLTKNNIRDTIQVKQRQKTVGQVEIAAVKNATTVFTAKYPNRPTEGKVVRKTSGIWAQDQARCNLLTERLYKWLSRPYTLTVPVDPGLILFDGGLELADRVRVVYDGPAEDADTGHGVHLAIDNDFFIYGANITYDAQGYFGTATLTLEYDNAA